MTQLDKLFSQILSAKSDKNIRFSDLVKLLHNLGFEARVRGSHHIFSRADIPDIITLQVTGGKAKAYQVKQVRNIIHEYVVITLMNIDPQKYEIILYWSQEDDVFIAEVPQLKGCVTHGASPTDALKAAHEAIEGWLMVAREANRVIPEPIGRRLMLA